jgi:hypothetical protein
VATSCGWGAADHGWRRTSCGWVGGRGAWQASPVVELVAEMAAKLDGGRFGSGSRRRRGGQRRGAGEALVGRGRRSTADPAAGAAGDEDGGWSRRGRKGRGPWAAVFK